MKQYQGTIMNGIGAIHIIGPTEEIVQKYLDLDDTNERLNDSLIKLEREYIKVLKEKDELYEFYITNSNPIFTDGINPGECKEYKNRKTCSKCGYTEPIVKSFI